MRSIPGATRGKNEGIYVTSGHWCCWERPKDARFHRAQQSSTGRALGQQRCMILRHSASSGLESPRRMTRGWNLSTATLQAHVRGWTIVPPLLRSECSEYKPSGSATLSHYRGAASLRCATVRIRRAATPTRCIATAAMNRLGKGCRRKPMRIDREDALSLFRKCHFRSKRPAPSYNSICPPTSSTASAGNL
jgi:hypothetical protein